MTQENQQVLEQQEFGPLFLPTQPKIIADVKQPFRVIQK